MCRCRDRFHCRVFQLSLDRDRIITFPDRIEPADELYVVLPARLLSYSAMPQKRHDTYMGGYPGGTTIDSRAISVISLRSSHCNYYDIDGCFKFGPGIGESWNMRMLRSLLLGTLLSLAMGLSAQADMINGSLPLVGIRCHPERH